MSWEWLPETPEEIAEYQRMRENLIECQQMSTSKTSQTEEENTENGARPRSLLVALAVVSVLIYFLFFRGWV